MTIVTGVALTTIYLLAVGSWTLWDAALGAGLASIGLLRFRSFVLPLADPRLRSHPLTSAVLVLRLIGMMVSLFVQGTGRVLRASLGGACRPGFVEVPIESNSDAMLALSVFMLTVAPDAFVVEADRHRGVLVVQVIDTTRAESIRRQHSRTVERYVQPLFSNR